MPIINPNKLKDILPSDVYLDIAKELSLDEDRDRDFLDFDKYFNRLTEETYDKYDSEIFKIAVDDQTPSEILMLLTSDDNWETRKEIILNKNCTVEILEKLSNDCEEEVRCVVLRHLNCPVEILEKLSNDYDEEVRCGVSRHPNCPVEILEKLSNDCEKGVRYALTENENCTVEILEKLSNDCEEEIRYAVGENPNCPVEILEKISNDCLSAPPHSFNSIRLQFHLVRNPNTPFEILSSLAKHSENIYVLKYIAEHKNIMSTSNDSVDIMEFCNIDHKDISKLKKNNRDLWM
ncbi:MAG: hypothetical protein ACRDCC_08370 [Culicoidibacterales bacterium]